MRFLLIFIFTFLVQLSFGQSFIDSQQKKIDKKDGVQDNLIDLGNEQLNQDANNAFFTLIDQLQIAIINSNFTESEITGIQKNLFSQLALLNNADLLEAKNYGQQYTFLIDWFARKDASVRSNLLFTNAQLGFQLLPIVKDLNESKQFLNEACFIYASEVLSSFPEYQSASYSDEILKKVCIIQPYSAKRYFSDKYLAFERLQSMKNDTIQLILNIAESLPRNTKAYFLSDHIYNGKLSLSGPDSLFKANENDYLKQLIQVASSVEPIAELSLDDELSYLALNYIRPVNDLHEMHEAPTRFKSMKNLTLEELYFLMIYSREEIFTSSFNGIFEIFLNKLEKREMSIVMLFEQIHYQKFRQFITMTSGYGKLDVLLASSSTEETEKMFQNFVFDLSQNRDVVNQAVSIAEAFSSISNTEQLQIIEDALLVAFYKEQQSDVKSMYGLLIHLFGDNVESNNMEIDSISVIYPVVDIRELSNETLLGEDGINTQVHFFYDDEDGAASFYSFISFFKSLEWIITFEEKYIVITAAKQSNIQIYANKPNSEKSAIKLIKDELQEKGNDIDLLVHRGHSFYVSKTIEHIPSTAKLVLLGSCGGYHRLTEIIQKSPDVHIISTKQIGSQHVNNPLLLSLSTKIRDQEDINWVDFWNEMDQKFAKSGYANSKFQEYIGPHQNLGARFIQAYNNYIAL